MRGDFQLRSQASEWRETRGSVSMRRHRNTILLDTFTTLYLYTLFLNQIK